MTDVNHIVKLFRFPNVYLNRVEDDTFSNTLLPLGGLYLQSNVQLNGLADT